MTGTATKLDPPDVLFIKAFNEALVAAGVSDDHRDAALRAAQAKHGKFWTQELGMFALQTFARALAEQVGDPYIGLRIATHVQKGATGVVEYAMVTAPTLRSMHEVHARLSPLVAEYLAYSMLDQGGYTLTTFTPPKGVKVDRVIEDYRVVRMVYGARRALQQPDFSPSAVHFTYARPPSLTPYEQVFGKNVSLSFGQAAAGVQIPSSVLDSPLPTSDPLLHSILMERAEQMVNEGASPSTLAARVRQALVSSLPSGRPAIGEVAKRLSLSERTLRRRLAEEGTSFAELLDEVRASLSRELAKGPEHNGKGVATKLGFESTSAFRRAQKRWATRAPRESGVMEPVRVGESL